MTESFENTPPFYHDFVEIWQDINGTQKAENWEEKYKMSCELLNQSAISNKHFVTIYDTLKQKVVFLSDNIRAVLGGNFSTEYYQYHPVLFWMENGNLKQTWFLMKLSLFFRGKVQKIFKENPSQATAVWYFHNIMFKNNSNHIGIRGESLEVSKNGAMRLQMSVIQEISPLIKDQDVWWAEVKINESIYYHFSNELNKFKLGRLLSVRELEITKLVSDGMDSKTIADNLFLSKHTINTHRKNILKKTGMKDFSSLVYTLRLYDSL